MNNEVRQWLIENELEELNETFTRHKLLTFRRIKALSDELIRDLVPEIGLRADLLHCLAALKAADIKAVKSAELLENKIEYDIAEEMKQKGAHDEIGNQVHIYQLEEVVLSGEITAVDSNCVNSEKESEGTISRSPSPLTGSSKSDKSVSRPSCSVATCSKSLDTEKKIHSGKSGAKNSLPRQLNSWKSLETLKTVDLRTLLEGDINSKSSLANYEQKGTLTDKDRSEIVTVVARHMLHVNYRPSTTEYQLMTTKICEFFSFESPEIYFCAPTAVHKNSTGKLVNKVRNIKFAISSKASGSLPKQTVLDAQEISPSTSRQHNKTPLTKAATLRGCSDKSAINETVKCAILALKHQSTDSWPEILKNWSITHPLRYMYLRENRPAATQELPRKVRKIHNIENHTEAENEGNDNEETLLLVNEYFLEWSILSAANGHLLISQDFNELYPGRGNSLFAKWERTKQLIITLARHEVTKADAVTAQLLSEIGETPEEKHDILILYLLVGLCSKRGRGNSASSSPSAAEARKYFIFHVKTPGDLNREIRNRRRFLVTQGSRVQPTIVIVGPSLTSISGCYVQVDNIRYKLRTPLAAVNLCFQAFFSLDAAYPVEAYAVWLFIQRYLFEMYLAEDVSNARVTSVISSFHALASKCDKNTAP